MTRIVVTGAGGFIASVVTDRLLADGHVVLGIDDWSTGNASNLLQAGACERFRFLRADIRDERLLGAMREFEPELVMHLAAQSCMRPSVVDPIHDASVNVLGSLNVLRAAVEAGARKVVYAASGGTLYGEPDRVPVPEEDRFRSRPSSPYGISKRVVEDYLHFFQGAYGLDFVMLAMANVYGPRQDPMGEAGVISIFAGKMLRGETPTILGDGEQTRDYVFVDDVADAFSRAIEHGSGCVLNVGSGEQVSTSQIHRLLADLFDFRAAPTHAPAKPGEPRRVALDVREAARVLGWSPTTPFADGVARTVAWVRGPGRERFEAPALRSARVS